MGSKLTLFTLAAMAATISLANAASFQERALAGGGDERIIGGTDAKSGSADWAVSLRRGLISYCGGTLVHPVTNQDKDGNYHVEEWSQGQEDARWVMTAAHCLYARGGRPLESEEIIARTGIVNLTESDSRSDRQVLAILEHPGYNSETLENDIALLLLAPSTGEPMANRGSAALPSDDDASWVNEPYLQTYALGWGVTEKGPDGVNTLKQVRVPLMENSYCRSKYQEAGSDILPGMICAGFALGEFDSCQGDSGGPLVHRTRDSAANRDSRATLLGVVSWGIGCARPSLPGVYTSVQYFKTWLETAVESCLAKDKVNCTQRATGYRDDKSSGRVFTRMISGDIVLFPEGCEENDAIICRLGEPIRFEQKPNLVWESDVWTSDKVQSGTTDGASIPKWAQPVIGKPFDRSYLKAAIIHDHYCYKENHVRTWQQVHRMFYDALIDSGISYMKARTMYYAVLLGGPRWKDLVPGEYCGVGCIKTRMESAGFPSDGEWQPALYEKNGFAKAVSDLQTEQETTGMLDLAEIERRAAIDRKSLVE